jgi:signal transduction histidine kinase
MAVQADAGDIAVNILIVDDDPRNLMVLETVLAGASYRLVRAASGEEALMALVNEEFAVLVLDIQMPGMSGLELAHLVKQRRRTASIPIIFLTAYFNDDKHVLEGYDTGAVDYLHKPVNPAVLRSKVAVFAELHRQRVALARANERLQAEVAERRAAEARLSELNASLDQRVAERTEALAKSEAQLRDRNRRRDQFLATLAHELRNPLAPVRNAVHILGQKCGDEPDARWASAVIDRQVRSMSRLIEDLMDVSRIDRDRIELRRDIFDLRGAVEDAVEVVQVLVDDCGHRLEVDLSGEALPVDADRARIAQVLVNLLNNAAKYTDRGGHITLAAQREGAEVVVRVKDTGIGIALARLQTVFEMFAQEEDALARARGGLGIGLALTRKLVAMHGGEVLARSAGPGQGSEFEVRLPLAGVARPTSAPVPMPALVTDGRQLRILIADDNVDAAATLGMLLETMGHSVLHVQDGESAVEAAQAFDPQLVLLDIGMPRLNGYEACQRIRTLPGGKARTVAAVTGWGQPKDLTQSAAAGFDRHLVKPIELNALVHLIEQTAATKQ